MQYIHKPFLNIFGPADLHKRKRKFIFLLRKNGLYSCFRKKMDDEKIQKIYNFYKQNKTSQELGFNTTDTKKRLLKYGKHRCCFCGRFIQEEKGKDPNFKAITIEHFKTESKYPLMILDWKNLFPSCNECNNNRGDKSISFSPPSSWKFKKKIKSLFFSCDGHVYCKNKSLDTYLTTYKLNSNNLVADRSRFYLQIVNSNFDTLLKLEKSETDNMKNAIIFVDEYTSVSKFIKKIHKHNCELLKIAKEVLSNA